MNGEQDEWDGFMPQGGEGRGMGAGNIVTPMSCFPDVHAITVTSVLSCGGGCKFSPLLCCLFHRVTFAW